MGKKIEMNTFDRKKMPHGDKTYAVAKALLP
jgi:hypothetical protein